MSSALAVMWAMGRQGENTEVRAGVPEEAAFALKTEGGDDSDRQWQARASS